MVKSIKSIAGDGNPALMPPEITGNSNNVSDRAEYISIDDDEYKCKAHIIINFYKTTK